MSVSPGTSQRDLDTPTLCADLDVLERNTATLAGIVAAGGKAWRPHVKSHRSPPLARRLVEAGAIGVTCATLVEAEQMAAAGIRDLLIANLLVGPSTAARFAALCEVADPIATCDHYAQVEPLASACRARGVVGRVVVEVDIGMNRVGIRPGTDARDLARAVHRTRGLRLAGVMGYEGHLLAVDDPDEKRRRIGEAIGVLVHTANLVRRDGLPCEITSAGGTGSCRITSACDGVTEIQAGGGIFGDPYYTNVCRLDGFEPALSVLATVVSRPVLERAVVDAGRKTLNGELHPPLVRGRADAEVTRLSAEHGMLSLGPESRDLRIGDRIELVPGYSDFTLVLHREIAALRGDVVEAVWPIGGRYREA